MNGLIIIIIIIINYPKVGGLSYPGAPAWPPGHPANLSVTDSAAQPITALLLLDNDATLRTVHGLPRLHQGLAVGAFHIMDAT